MFVFRSDDHASVGPLGCGSVVQEQAAAAFERVLDLGARGKLHDPGDLLLNECRDDLARLRSSPTR